MVSPSLKWDPGCSTRVEYLKECVRITFLLISSSLRPLHPVHFEIFLPQIFYQEVHISCARNFPRAYSTREKYFFLESAWMCNCWIYIVGVFHCLGLLLAMWHSCVFSQQMHGLAVFEMTSRVFHACRIPEECVRVTFLLISSSLRPLHPVHFEIYLAQIFYQEVHRLAFSYVTQLRFQSTDAWSRPLWNEIAGVPRVWNTWRVRARHIFVDIK